MGNTSGLSLWDNSLSPVSHRYRLIGDPEIECVIRHEVLTWDKDIPTCQGKQSSLIIYSLIIWDVAGAG